MTEDRSWQYRSGHCLQLGKPDCRGCTVDDCTCPSDWCVAKRQVSGGVAAADRTSERLDFEATKRSPGRVLARSATEASTDYQGVGS